MKSASYRLHPDRTSLDAIEATFAAYARMHAILENTEPTRRSDTFELQRLAYEKIRTETDLASRLVTNGIREYASGSFSFTRLPLDEKLFQVKSADSISLATVTGRVVVPFVSNGYVEGAEKSSLSHLVRNGDGSLDLYATLSATMQKKEFPMQTESIAGRASRLAAGFVHTIIQTLEDKSPAANAEQAIREIDKAIQDANDERASALAERKRFDMQKTALKDERRKVDENTRLALKADREDLARVGIERQDDIDSQVEALEKLIDDVDGRIADYDTAIRAASAARREAARKVDTLVDERKKASPAGKNAATGGSAIESRIANALGAVDRATKIPSGPQRDSRVDELEELGRNSRIDDRLEALRREMTENRND